MANMNSVYNVDNLHESKSQSQSLLKSRMEEFSHEKNYV